MSKAKKIRNFMEDRYERIMIANKTRKSTEEYRNQLLRKYKNFFLSPVELKEMNELFFQSYGKLIPCHWHMFYKQSSGKYDSAYFPVNLMPKLIYYANPENMAKILEDMNFFASVADSASVRFPKVVLKRSRAVFTDGDNHIISRQMAMSIMSENDNLIMKDAENHSICSDFENENFIMFMMPETGSFIDENRDSITITTFKVRDRIFAAPGVYSNESEEGVIFAGIDDDGRLSNGSTKEISEYRSIQKEACRMHSFVPQMGIVTWQFTADRCGKPILTDWSMTDFSNLHRSQMTNGRGIFGEHTDYILSWLANAEKISAAERISERLCL